MRNRHLGVIALLEAGFALPLACGGGQGARDSAASPTATAGATATSSPSNASTEAATTTAMLSDAGDLQGEKLTETHTISSPAPGASSAPKATHAHEPGRGAADIRAIVLAHRDEARACYDNASADHPGIEGDLVITWTIDSKGNVTQTSMDASRSTLVEPTLVACISDVIKKIVFAPSPGGFETKAFYPFNFHPHRRKPSP
jgi:hypothetical protein